MRKQYIAFEVGMESIISELGFTVKSEKRDGYHTWIKQAGPVASVEITRYGAHGTHTIGYDVWLYVKNQPIPITLFLSARPEDLRSRALEFVLNNYDLM